MTLLRSFWFAAAVSSLVAPSTVSAQQTTDDTLPTDAATQPPVGSPSPDASREDEEPLPPYPVELIATGVPLSVVGAVMFTVGVYGASNWSCTGFCLDWSGIYAAVGAVGAAVFMVGFVLLITGGAHWAQSDSERERIRRRRAGEVVLDGHGVGLRL